jgi:hypothetical protein
VTGGAHSVKMAEEGLVTGRTECDFALRPCTTSKGKTLGGWLA